MSNRLTLEALEVLDAIDRKGSFAAAAATLYKVPSAVTYSMQKLEQDLGVTLFIRQGRKSILTPAGQALLAQGRELLAAADRLVEQTRQIDSGWESCLNIAVDTIFDITELYPSLTGLTEQHPQLELNLYDEVLGGTWEALVSGRVDLAVGVSEPPNHTQGFTLLPFGSVEMVPMVAPTHPLAQHQGIISDEQLAHYRAIVVRDSSKQLPPLTRNLLERQPRLSVTTIPQKISAQMAGLGCGYLPRCAVQSYVEQGRLVELATESGSAISPLYLGHRNNHKGRALKWLVSDLLKRGSSKQGDS